MGALPKALARRGHRVMVFISSISLYLCTLRETTDAVSAAMHLNADSELLSFVKHVEKKVNSHTTVT